MRRLRIRYGAFALDTTIYFFRHRGRIFARPFSRVRITVYHFRDILVNLLRNYISHRLGIVTIQVTVAGQRRQALNIRKNTRNAKRLQDFIHIAHFLEFLTTDAVTKIPNAWKTLCKNRFSHMKNLQKIAREKERKEKEKRNLPTGKPYLVRRCIGRSINNYDMLNRSNNAFNFVPVGDMNELEVLGMTANKNLLILKEVAERADSFLRSTKKTRRTISISFEVTNYTKNLIHNSLVLGGLGKIP